MRRILVVSADRSEKGLLDPIYEELVKREDVIVKWCLLDSHADPASNIISYLEELEDFQPHIVLLPTDRSEIVYAAAYSFHKGFVNVHFHAGNLPANHPDDLNRKVISTFSHIMLCNMSEHKQNLIRQGEDSERIFVTGSTAFDSISFDDSVTPKESFNLVILHPNPDSEEETKKDLSSTVAEILHSGRTTVWIYPNHDKNYEIIEKFLENSLVCAQKYRALPRSQYLSLLKNCSYFIGNSSSAYYELPVLNPNATLIQIGERNKGLVVPKTVTGGSKRIANLLATIELTENLRMKRLKE